MQELNRGDMYTTAYTMASFVIKIHNFLTCHVEVAASLGRFICWNLFFKTYSKLQAYILIGTGKIQEKYFLILSIQCLYTELETHKREIFKSA